MNEFLIVLLAIGLIGTSAYAFVLHRQTSRTMTRIKRMIDAAQEGQFSEELFDESRLSELETRFAHYLTASSVSAQNVRSEKDKIKTLIADISHQTKTPIANLLLYCELLEEENLSDGAMNQVHALHGQIEKLRFLIDALVKLSRLENGILTLSPERNPIQPMLQKAVEQYRLKAEQKGLMLRLASTDCTACFDVKWTSEALCNLLDNAVKYTACGDITVSVVPYELFVRIDIADTGCGIPEEEQPRVFSRFYRGEAVRGEEGVGLGLYLVREILTAEGGYVRVRSQYGSGATFSAFLPA